MAKPTWIEEEEWADEKTPWHGQTFVSLNSFVRENATKMVNARRTGSSLLLLPVCEGGRYFQPPGKSLSGFVNHQCSSLGGVGIFWLVNHFLRPLGFEPHFESLSMMIPAKSASRHILRVVPLVSSWVAHKGCEQYTFNSQSLRGRHGQALSRGTFPS